MSADPRYQPGRETCREAASSACTRFTPSGVDMRNRQSANLMYYSRNEDRRVSIDRVNSAAHTPRKRRVGPSAHSTINHLVTVWFGYFPATGAGGSKIVPVPSILYGEVDCQSSLFRQLRPELDRMRANSGVWNAISTAGQIRKGCPCVEALCGNQLHRVRASVRKQQSCDPRPSCAGDVSEIRAHLRRNDRL